MSVRIRHENVAIVERQVWPESVHTAKEFVCVCTVRHPELGLQDNDNEGAALEGGIEDGKRIQRQNGEEGAKDKSGLGELG